MRELPSVIVAKSSPSTAEQDTFLVRKIFLFVQTMDPETGKFLSSEKLKEEFKKIGVDDSKTIICYCGSGVSACTDILALKMAGFEAQLYEGSWSDWSKDLNLAIAKK